MFRFRNFLPLVVTALIGAAVLGAPSKAHASLIISAQEAGVNGGAITQVGVTGADFTATSFTGAYGDFSISIFGGSSDNGATLSDLLSSTTSVKNLDTLTAGAHTLTLYVSQTNYTLPSSLKLNMESGLGGTQSSGTVGLTGIFQAYADAGNNSNGLGGATNGPQNASLNVSTFDTGSANGSFTRGAGNYSLTSVATLNMERRCTD